MATKKTTRNRPAQKEQSIEIVRPGNPGASFSEALQLTKGKRIISNLEADALLQNKETYDKYRSLFSGSAWTSTIYIYEEPGVSFGTEVSTDYFTFKVPKQYQGKKDTVLVFSLYDCKITGTGQQQITLNKPAKVIAHHFPTENSEWYLPDVRTGIPTGGIIDRSDPKARYLWRRSEAWIGPLVRWGLWLFGDGRRGVGAGNRPGGRRGVGVVVGAKTHSAKGKKHRCNCEYCTQKGDTED